MHLDAECVERWLHDELEPGARRDAAAHLAQCAECRARVEAAAAEEAWIRGALATLPSPAIAAPVVSDLRRQESRRRLAGWAAAILLSVTAAGTAYALPGSPLPGWVSAAREWFAPPAPAPAPRRLTPSVTGLVLPGEPRLTIRFAGVASTGQARVALVDTGGVRVRMTPGAATFTTSPGLLVITIVDSGASFELDIPRDAPLVAVEAGGARRFLKEGGSVTLSLPGDSAGRYAVPLGRTGEP